MGDTARHNIEKRFVEKNGKKITVSNTLDTETGIKITINIGGKNELIPKDYFWRDRNGQYDFYDTTGNKYQGNHQLIVDATKSLKILMSKPVGKALITYIAHDIDHDVQIIQGTFSTADMTNGELIRWNNQEGKQQFIPTQEGSIPTLPFVSMGHEFAHIQDVWKDTITYDT